MTILVRLLVFVGLYAAALGVAHVADVDPLGLGLLLFLGLACLALGWAFLDGRRRPLGRVLLTWAVVAVGTGVAMSAGTALQDGTTDLGVVLDDLVWTVPFTLGLVGVPALVGALVALLAGGRADAARTA